MAGWSSEVLSKWEWRDSRLSRDRRAMLSGGFTGQLFGEFTKAMRVYGGYVYVRCALRECCEVLGT